MSYLYGIGKVTMVKVLGKGLMLQSLGQVDSEMADVITESSQFITNSYGCKPDNNMSSTHTLQCLDIKISHVKASAVQQSLCHLQLRHLRNMFEEHIIRLQFGWLHCSQTRLILISLIVDGHRMVQVHYFLQCCQITLHTYPST